MTWHWYTCSINISKQNTSMKKFLDRQVVNSSMSSSSCKHKNQNAQNSKLIAPIASSCIIQPKHVVHFQQISLNQSNRKETCSYTQMKIQISWPGHYHFKHAMVCWNQLKKIFHKHIMAQQIMEIDHLLIFEEN